MGKYKQWLHHQEVGARLRDEIAAHEAERERVLKLAPTRTTPLPDLTNPIIAALLGQTPVLKAPAQAKVESSQNGASAAAAKVERAAVAEVSTAEVTAAAAPGVAASETLQDTKQTVVAEARVLQGESAPVKTTTGKLKAVAPAKSSAEKQPAAAAASPRAEAPGADKPAQPETVDPFLEQLLAQAEQAPADPLAALNLLASQGQNLTRGEAPQPLVMPPAAPAASTGQSALSALLGESRGNADPQKATSEPASAPVAVGVETIAVAEASVRTETAARVEKARSDTDELVAARPTEGYTEPRLIVPQWLKSMELSQNQDGEKAEDGEEGDGKQRFSVSLPFENEEDMRLHESVERWWQRWRQQS